jgi:EAL domain-containing protein (putative c-di-GMP-specific phosphodiesterase class I)
MRSCTLSHSATAHLRLRASEPQPRAHRYGHALSAWSSPAGLHRRPWLARLRYALDEGLFAVHYQPIVSLVDGHPAHYEALVRLADEGEGDEHSARLIPPARFLPAAERYGLIREIDRLVLDRVLATLAQRRARHDADLGARIAVNLSALSVTDPTMLDHLARALERHGVDPSLLVLEITETAAISDMTRARAFCRGVAALGCAVALDDFGAGFGSFQYITKLPFDYLKIDGSFIRSLPSSLNDQLVVQALVGLARGMGVRTIAEYVTDRATLELLCSYGVDYAQGFELGRPRPM